MKSEKQLDSKTVYDGKVVRLQVDRVMLPDGKETTREVVRHRGAVAISAVGDNRQVWLVRQHRYAPGEDLLELPAGKLEAGEEPLRAARRELLEEVGVRAAHWEKLATFYTSPGFSDEELILYLAEGLEVVNETDKPQVEGEFVTRELWQLDDAVAAAYQGRIRDAKTIVGLLMAAART